MVLTPRTNSTLGCTDILLLSLNSKVTYDDVQDVLRHGIGVNGVLVVALFARIIGRKPESTQKLNITNLSQQLCITQDTRVWI